MSTDRDEEDEGIWCRQCQEQFPPEDTRYIKGMMRMGRHLRYAVLRMYHPCADICVKEAGFNEVS